jgi:hypothetical protein
VYIHLAVLELKVNTAYNILIKMRGDYNA